VQDMGGFGLYANGVGVGDRRYQSPQAADVNFGHTIRSNVFIDGGRQIEYGSGVWLFQVGRTVIEHNVISRFPRDGVGFFGMLPFWTAVPGGPSAPRSPPANKSSSERRPWGRFVTCATATALCRPWLRLVLPHAATWLTLLDRVLT
jgi:hypothetical protein